jgi:hypothetical protein
MSIELNSNTCQVEHLSISILGYDAWLNRAFVCVKSVFRGSIIDRAKALCFRTGDLGQLYTTTIMDGLDYETESSLSEPRPVFGLMAIRLFFGSF